VETEHLLYGFTTLRDGTSVALEKNKVSTSAAQTALRAMHGGDGDSGAGGGGGLSGMFGKQAKAANTAEMLPFAPAVDTAFQAANKAAKAEEDGKVNSRVLLLALLQDEDSGAMRMLATMGVDPVQLETDLSPRAQVNIWWRFTHFAQSEKHTSHDCNRPLSVSMARADTFWPYRPHKSLPTTAHASRFPRSKARRRKPPQPRPESRTHTAAVACGCSWMHYPPARATGLRSVM
jgi:ATP-dependent Clp protease ATP-binding subunit ClpA